MSSTAQIQVITLGTAGGPRMWLPQDGAEPRCGIATAVVVGDRWYLFDCGQSVYRQVAKAGLDLKKLAGIFITHLHSDHTIDLINLMVFGLYSFAETERTVPIYGPGDRGALPPVSPRATGEVTPAFPKNPVPGVSQMVYHLLQSHATDLNDRVLDSLRPNPANIFQPHDIEIPERTGFHPNENPYPEMEPFTVFEDDAVRVLATLVMHPPIAPAFAFRIEAGDKSVTISGDTRFCENLVALSRGTDLLLHEAIDVDWISATYKGDTEGNRAAVDHHRKSHTLPEEAGEIAQRAQAKRLALHHLVPGTSPVQAWERASATFAGELLIPEDNQVIDL